MIGVVSSKVRRCLMRDIVSVYDPAATALVADA